MRLITSLITVTIICSAIVCMAQWERRTVEVDDYYLDGAYATVIFDINSDRSGSFAWEVTFSDERGGNKRRDSRTNWRAGDASVSDRVMVGRDARIHNIRVTWVGEN